MIWSIITSTWFYVNIIVGLLMVEYALFKTRAVRKVDEARDGKYSAFRRTDVQKWKRSRLYIAAPFILPRFFFCLMLLCIHLPFCKLVLSIGVKRG